MLVQIRIKEKMFYSQTIMIPNGHMRVINLQWTASRPVDIKPQLVYTHQVHVKSVNKYIFSDEEDCCLLYQTHFFVESSLIRELAGSTNPNDVMLLSSLLF